MPQAYYERHDDVGELVLDAPPLNLFGPAMFDDLEAAIAEGATIVRVGTALFGPRAG